MLPILIQYKYIFILTTPVCWLPISFFVASWDFFLPKPGINPPETHTKHKQALFKRRMLRLMDQHLVPCPVCRCNMALNKGS